MQAWRYRRIDHFRSCWGIKVFPNFTYGIQVIVYAYANFRHLVNKNPGFLGGSPMGVIKESPRFTTMYWLWLVSLWMVIAISSVLSSFNFKMLLVIQIFISLIRVSLWYCCLLWYRCTRDKSMYVPTLRINKKPTMFRIVAWWPSGEKPLWNKGLINWRMSTSLVSEKLKCPQNVPYS